MGNVAWLTCPLDASTSVNSPTGVNLTLPEFSTAIATADFPATTWWVAAPIASAGERSSGTVTTTPIACRTIWFRATAPSAWIGRAFSRIRLVRQAPLDGGPVHWYSPSKLGDRVGLGAPEAPCGRSEDVRDSALWLRVVALCGPRKDRTIGSIPAACGDRPIRPCHSALSGERRPGGRDRRQLHENLVNLDFVSSRQ